MNKSVFLLLAIIFIALTTNGQTIDEIVKKYETAMGGKEKLDSLKTVVFEGTFRIEKFELPLKAYLVNNTGQRYDVMVMKVPGYIIATPEAGWQYFPFQGMKEPKAITQEELDSYLPYMDLQGALYNYKQKGTNIKDQGLEEVEEATCHKLLVTLISGKKMISYIDTLTHFMIKSVLYSTVNGKEILLENRYGNFQKTPEGYMFPFALTLGPGQAFVSRVYINKPVETSLFNTPATKKPAL